MIKKILKLAPSNAKWFDIVEISGNSTPIIFKNNRLYSAIEKHSNGYGIRVNIDGKTGFSYANNEKNVDNMVETAVTLSKYGDNENFSLPSACNKNFEPFDSNIDKFNIKNEIKSAEKAISILKKHYPESNTNLSINRSSGSMSLINSEGLELYYNNSYYSVSISITLILENGNKIDIWESKSALSPVNYDEIVEEILEKVKNSTKVQQLSSGKIPVLFTPKAFSSLLRILKSGLNSKAVHKGLSPFKNKINEKMFNESLTIFDDPQLEDSPFSFPFDDEGVESKRKALINRGVISNFINDLKYSEKLGMAPTGNASRGYSSLPNPTFSNIILDNGDKSLDKILQGIDRGILVDQFIGLGQSNTLAGDFSANLDLAYLIEKGEISGRVKDCMITDNIFKLLDNEMQFSSERKKVASSLVPHAYFPEVDFTG